MQIKENAEEEDREKSIFCRIEGENGGRYEDRTGGLCDRNRTMKSEHCWIKVGQVIKIQSMDSNTTCHGAKTEAKIAIACREVILKITAEYIGEDKN